jgi:hypothetical protein
MNNPMTANRPSDPIGDRTHDTGTQAGYTRSVGGAAFQPVRVKIRLTVETFIMKQPFLPK